MSILLLFIMQFIFASNAIHFNQDYYILIQQTIPLLYYFVQWVRKGISENSIVHNGSKFPVIDYMMFHIVI